MEHGWLERERGRELAREGTSIHRVYRSGEAWVDRFGEDYLVCPHQADVDLRSWPEKVRSWADEAGFLVERVFARPYAEKTGERGHYELLTGPKAPLRGRAQEGGVHYWIDFSAGYSNGFFLDQRENRRLLRQMTPRRLLNLFSYTCSFSLTAALTGAETCSVDVSKKSLDWGKENFGLNAVETARHRFMTDDVREAVRRMKKRGEKFDAIICDPPTFGRNREGKVWKIDKDLSALVPDLLFLLLDGGHLLLSTNYTEWGEEHLIKLVEGSAQPLPASQPVDLGVDEGARTVWFRK